MLANMLIIVRTITWYSLGWFYLIITYPILLKVLYLDRRKNKMERDRLVNNFTSSMSRKLIKLTGSTVEITGKENIPERGPVLFVSNHQGHFDSAIIHGFIDKPKGFVSVVEAKRYPILRTWMKYMNCIFMDRSNIKQSLGCINQGIELLKQGYSMVIFPEGRIPEDGQVGEFKRGSLKMAIKAGVLIVPVTINGSYKIMNKNGFGIRPAAVKCIISECIDTSNLSREEKDSLADQVRNTIMGRL